MSLDLMKLKIKGAKTTKGKIYEFMSIKHGLGMIVGNIVSIIIVLIVATPFNLEHYFMVWILPIPYTVFFAFCLMLVLGLAILLMIIWRPFEQGFNENEHRLFWTWLDSTIQMVEEALSDDKYPKGQPKEGDIVNSQGEVVDQAEPKVHSEALKKRILALKDSLENDSKDHGLSN